MDSNEDLLKGESVETPLDSSSEPKTPEESTQGELKSAELPSSEEESWNNLSGAAQERFRQVTRENNLLRQQMEMLRTQSQPSYQQPVYQQPVTNTDPYSPEIAQAVKKLSEVGIATKEEVAQEVNQRIGGLMYQMELDKLSNKYDGSNGLPKFDKDEYEDFVSRKPQYRNYELEDVYAKMYEPELTEWKLSNFKQTAKQQSTTLKPTRSTVVREEPLTPEVIEQRLKEPDGPAWYDKNFEKVNAVLRKGQTDAW